MTYLTDMNHEERRAYDDYLRANGGAVVEPCDACGEPSLSGTYCGACRAEELRHGFATLDEVVS